MFEPGYDEITTSRLLRNPSSPEIAKLKTIINVLCRVITISRIGTTILYAHAKLKRGFLKRISKRVLVNVITVFFQTFPSISLLL